MAPGSEGDRSERERDEREPPALSGSARSPKARAADAYGVDDALRIAVEALSAEICWFVANDAGARGVFVPATESRPPTP
jgi:hypothetical protein